MGVYTWVKIGCKYPLQTGQYWVQINTEQKYINTIDYFDTAIARTNAASTSTKKKKGK